MQGAEDEVAGFGGGDRRGDRLEVAHFADEDHVRVLAERAADRLGERRHVVADLALGDKRVLRGVVEFDRVLDGDDVDVALAVDDVDHRGERRRLAGAGGAGHEDEAARLEEELLDDGRKTDLLEREQRRGNLAEHRAVALPLLEDADTEAGAVRVGKREVGAAGLLYFLHRAGVAELLDHLAAELVGVLLGELLLGDRQQLAVHAQLRRHVGADVQV